MALKIKGDNHSLLNFQRNLKLGIFSLAIRNDVLVALRVEVLFTSNLMTKSCTLLLACRIHSVHCGFERFRGKGALSEKRCNFLIEASAVGCHHLHGIHQLQKLGRCTIWNKLAAAPEVMCK